MSPECFADALNYLDDDLIEQTDDLRQGRRVLQTRPTVRQVIRWAAPAACLVLLLGLGPQLIPSMETGDSAQFEGDLSYGGNQAPEEALYDYKDGSSSTQHECAGTVVVQDVSCGNIFLYLPENWTYELETGDDGSYGIVIRPSEEKGAIRVCYRPNFGVCGTGLTTEETTIAGMRANVGTYDGEEVWRFITFPDAEKWYVVLNEGADQWWDHYGETAMEILETIVIGEGA